MRRTFVTSGDRNWWGLPGRGLWTRGTGALSLALAVSAGCNDSGAGLNISHTHPESGEPNPANAAVGLPDQDGDGVPDALDPCKGSDASGDVDGDGICNDLAPWTLAGTVRDRWGSYVAFARVSTGDGAFSSADQNGHFTVRQVIVPPDGSVVVTHQADGFATTRHRAAADGPNRDAHILAVDGLMKRPDGGAWWADPQTDIVVNTPRVTLQVAAGSLVDASGTPFVGRVNIEVTTGDPSDPTDKDLMPGGYLTGDNGGTPVESLAFRARRRSGGAWTRAPARGNARATRSSSRGLDPTVYRSFGRGPWSSTSAGGTPNSRSTSTPASARTW